MRSRTRSQTFVLGAFIFFSNVALAGRVLSHYPTPLEIDRLLDQGLTSLEIRGGYDPVIGVFARIEYPSSSHADNLKLLSSIPVHLVTNAGAYPSRKAIQRLNDLENNVKLSVIIEGCLSSATERNRILQFERPAAITIQCNTVRETVRAEKIAAGIHQQNENVRITIETLN